MGRDPESSSGGQRIVVGRADAVEEVALGARFLVNAFPKIMLVEGGLLPRLRIYRGRRTEDELRDYIDGGYLEDDGLAWSDYQNPMAPWVSWAFLYAHAITTTT